jgi:carbon-monoxide dehydrogenase medium subunit
MIPAAFEYHAPSTLREALAILRRYPGDAKVLAGGHSLLPVMKLRLSQPSHVVDLAGIDGLSYIREQDGGLAIGPMTTYYELETSPVVRQWAPILGETAAQVADLQVRNKGTIGGSLAHADPAADLTAVVLALDARIRTSGSGRGRRVPADRFFVDIFATALEDSELITEVIIPASPPNTGGSYQKFANKASHFAIVGVAALVSLDPQGRCRRVRIAVTGAGLRPVRARASERYLTGREPTAESLAGAAQRAANGIECLEDLHGSAEYREHLTRVMAGRALTRAVSRAQDL